MASSVSLSRVPCISRFRWGLAIQGPLLSKGVTGRAAMGKLTAGWKSAITPDDIVEFDCRENIRRIVRAYGPLFSEIVLATWKSEVGSNEEFEGVRLLELEDPLKHLEVGVHSNPDRRARLPINKLRQYVSSAASVQALHDVDFILRIRTDHFLDAAAIVNHVENFEDRDSRIFVPGFIRSAGMQIDDRYFAGKASQLRRFFDSLVAHNCAEFCSDVHMELWLKYAYERFGCGGSQSERAFFPRAGRAEDISHDTVLIGRRAFKELFAPLPRDVWMSVEWRGEPLVVDASSPYASSVTGEHSEAGGFRVMPSGRLGTAVRRFCGTNWHLYGTFLMGGGRRGRAWRGVYWIADRIAMGGFVIIRIFQALKRELNPATRQHISRMNIRKLRTMLAKLRRT